MGFMTLVNESMIALLCRGRLARGEKLINSLPDFMDSAIPLVKRCLSVESSEEKRPEMRISTLAYFSYVRIYGNR